MNLRDHSVCLCLIFLVLIGSSCHQSEYTDEARAEKPSVNTTREVNTTFSSPSPQADSLLERAIYLTEEAQYDSASVVARMAQDVYISLDHREGIIRSENAEGDALERWGKYEEAMELLQSTLQKGRDWLGEDHLAMADTYNKLGILKKYEGDFIESLKLHNNALSIRAEHLTMEHPLVGRSLNNIGVVYADLGNYDRALNFYNEALEIRKSALGEKNVDVAQDYNNIAVALKNNGDFEQSLLYHDRALAIRQEILGGKHPAVGASYYNMGITYAQKGEYDLAIESHQRSMQIWQEAFPGGHPLIGLNYNALSVDYQYVEKFEDALAYEAMALEERKRKSEGLLMHDGNSFHNIGRIKTKLGKFEEALYYYNKALSNWKNSLGSSHPLLAIVYKDLGQAFFKQSEYQTALNYANLATQVNRLKAGGRDSLSSLSIEDFSSESILLESLNLKSRALKAMSWQKDEILYLVEAMKNYEITIDLIEQYSFSFKNTNSKLILAEQAALIYQQAINVALELYRKTGDKELLNTAFQFAEKGKVSVLLDAMIEADAREFAGIPDSLLEREKELRVLLTYYDNSLKEEEVKGEKANQEKVALWKREIFDLKKSYDDLLETFEDEYPSYYDLRYTRYTPTIQDVRDKIVGYDEVFLEYVVGTDSLYIFAITDTHQKVVAVQRDSTLEEDVEFMRRGIVERNREYYIPAAHRLFSLLVRPVIGMATANSKWVVVPDGVLNGVPFEALLRYEVPVTMDYHELPFVIDEHTIRYTYSATLEISQMALNNVLDEKREPDDRSNDFVAFAPVFEGGLSGNTRGAKLVNEVKPDSIENEPWGHLPQSEFEVKAIDTMFRKRYPAWERWFGQRSKLYLKGKASEAALKSMDLRSHRFIHFATHGILNEEIPELSGIVLSQDTTRGEDGVLHLGEVYNLDLDADLVVLSACQTGFGKMAKGEGLISLTRGFMYAGADALLASLWQVEDRSTREIMVDFYQRKLNGEPSAEAIRAAKVSLMEYHPLLSQPYYWAGFILIGK